MLQDEYKKAEQENLQNPKNRFLGICCHAREIDSSWGCDWSFQTGVVMFGILILIASFSDIYIIAGDEIFKKDMGGFAKFCFGVKVLIDVINLINVIASCFALTIERYKLAIICYYVAVASLILTTLCCIFIFIEIFMNWSYIWKEFISLIVLEPSIFMFGWILFCNQVDLGRKIRAVKNAPAY